MAGYIIATREHPKGIHLPDVECTVGSGGTLFVYINNDDVPLAVYGPGAWYYFSPVEDDEDEAE
jgi:hypothetical protein